MNSPHGNVFFLRVIVLQGIPCMRGLYKFRFEWSRFPPSLANQQSDRTARSMLVAFATMVDSRKGRAMADRIDHLTERVQIVEEKVDRLSSTVGQLSTRVDGLTTTVGELTTTVGGLTTTVGGLTTTVGGLTTTVGGLTTALNEQSTAMAAGFVEQREYTEFSHARLEAKMDAGFARVDRKLDQLIDAYRPRPKPKRRNE